MKRISVYVRTGNQAAVTYYRFAQYFDKLSRDVTYRKMIPDSRSADFLPISVQPRWKQVGIFFYILVRQFFNLLRDSLKLTPPQAIILSRTIIQRILPKPYLGLLKIAHNRGVRIIWDFDDNIIVTREVTRKGFDELSKIADVIVTGSPILQNLIKREYRDKAVYLTTTDGDIWSRVDNKTIEQRLSTLESEVRVIWVGTFPGLGCLKQVMPAMDLLGETIEKQNRQLVMTVVCDFPLEYEPNHFSLRNIQWEREVAIHEMLSAHVGLMPLNEGEASEGKCGFKLIQYLSAAMPVVGSDVGMNKMIITEKCGRPLKGFKAEEWCEAIKSLVANKDMFEEYCIGARKQWEMNFSYNEMFDKWKNLLTF